MTKLKTTCNIRKSQYKLILSSATDRNATISQLVNLLLKRALSKHELKVLTSKTVLYQSRLLNAGDSWHCFPVILEDGVYERCLDLRNVNKVSVSLFLSLAIDLYLKSVITDIEIKRSYNYSNYYKVLFIKEGDYCQIIHTWGEQRLEKGKNKKT